MSTEIATTTTNANIVGDATTTTTTTTTPPPPLTLNITSEHDVVGIKSKIKSIRGCVTVNAGEIAEDESNRAPVDVMVALDVSGSMSGTKLSLCKRTLTMLLRELTAKDRFGLVAYSSEAYVEFEPAFMDKENKEKALKAANKLETLSCTNLCAGLVLAAKQIKSIANPNQVQCIFLLTDGLANEGVTETSEIVSIVNSITKPGADISQFDNLLSDSGDNSFGSSGRRRRQSRPSWLAKKSKSAMTIFGSKSGSSKSSSDNTNKTVDEESIKFNNSENYVSVHCFGYGADHDSNMLQEIANATSGGAYYFVENDTDVGSAFGDAMGGLMSVVAQSAVITLKVPEEAKHNGVKIVSVHHDESIDRGNGIFTINVGDFYAEESRDVIFEFDLSNNNISSNEPIPHVEAKLQYVDTINKKDEVAGPVFCCVARPENSEEVSTPNSHVVSQWLRIHAANQIKLADEAAKNNELERARAMINDTLEAINCSSVDVKGSGTVMQAEHNLRSVLEESLASREVYRTTGSHKTKGYHKTLAIQRCSASTSAETNMYRSKAKGKYAKKFQISGSS